MGVDAGGNGQPVIDFAIQRHTAFQAPTDSKARIRACLQSRGAGFLAWAGSLSRLPYIQFADTP